MKSASIQDRLRSVMQQKNLRQVDVIRLAQPFCEEHGVKLTKTDLTQYLSGKTTPKKDKLFILALTLHVSEAWLMGFVNTKFDPYCHDNVDSLANGGKYFMSSLSIKLRKLRNEKNYSQKKVAADTGLSASQLNKYECRTGIRPYKRGIRAPL